MLSRKSALQVAFTLGTVGAAIPAMAQAPAPRSVLSWRVVVDRDGVHFGIPADSGQLVISELSSDGVTVLNLPRADPDAAGWSRSVQPAHPYVNPGATYGDVVRPALPDEVAAVGWDGLRFVIAVNTPDALPIARMPFFLIRVEPGSYAMQTYAMPPSARFEPVAIFVRGSLIVIANHEGDEFTVPRS
jgi:hypothetical protein